MDWTWYLFGFNGRINRAKYWLAGLIITCWMIFLMFLLFLPIGYFLGSATKFSLNMDNLLVIFDAAALRKMSRADIAVLIVNFLVMPLNLWVSLATSVKRLHDRDRSGGWLVLFFGFPCLYGRLEDYLPDSYWVQALGIIALVLCVWGFVELLFLRGTKWTNRFGPNPLGKEQMRARTERDRLRATTPWDQESEIEMVPKAGPPPVWHVKPGA